MVDWYINIKYDKLKDELLSNKNCSTNKKWNILYKIFKHYNLLQNEKH